MLIFYLMPFIPSPYAYTYIYLCVYICNLRNVCLQLTCYIFIFKNVVAFKNTYLFGCSGSQFQHTESLVAASDHLVLACGIQFPDQGLNPGPLHCECRVLATGPPEKSHFAIHLYIQWQWQPTPVLLPGKPHGWRNLGGCSPWGRTELDTTEATQQQQQPIGVTKGAWVLRELQRPKFIAKLSRLLAD